MAFVIYVIKWLLWTTVETIFIKRNLLFRFGACLHTQQTRRRPNDGSMLAHRLRRWPSIKPALVQRPV